jgi:protein-disulfide isomerase
VKVVRRPCHDLQAKLCGDLGDEAACDWARDNLLSRFPPEGCTEVMEGRYAELLGYVRQRQDQIRREEAQKKPLPGEVARKIATEGSPPAFGPVDARVVMVEFSDFQCPYCQRAGRAVERLRARYSGVIRFVFRQYPLPADTHPQADLCAQAALAAHAQDRFWDYHDLMFEEQPRLREGRPVLEELAEKIGLEMTAFRAALDGQQFRGTIDQEKALGEEAFVNGTPSIFIDGRRVKDPYSAASMSQEINDALTAAGVPIPPEPPPAPPAQPAADAAGPAPDAS